DGGVGEDRYGPGRALGVAEARRDGALGRVGAGHEVGAAAQALVLEATGEGAHGGGVGPCEQQPDGGDLTAGRVRVGGAQQPQAADGGEGLAQEGVEGVRAAAVGGDGDTGPGAVGAAGAGARAVDGGREEPVDGNAVPQG